MISTLKVRPFPDKCNKLPSGWFYWNYIHSGYFVKFFISGLLYFPLIFSFLNCFFIPFQAQISTVISILFFLRKPVIFFLLAERFDKVVSWMFFFFLPLRANKSIIPKTSVCLNLTFGANQVIQPSVWSFSMAFFLISVSLAMRIISRYCNKFLGRNRFHQESRIIFGMFLWFFRRPESFLWPANLSKWSLF